MYSEHPTTEVLCLVFRLPHWAEGRTAVWYPAFPELGLAEAECPEVDELFAWIESGGLVEAHGAFFEYCLWRNIMVARYGWDEIPDHLWRCSAAKAAAHSLPRSLEKAVNALGLPIKKDMEGSAVMKKMATPRRALKRDIVGWNRQHNPCAPCSASGKVQEFKKNGEPKKNLSKCKACDGTGIDAEGFITRSVPPLPLLWHFDEEALMRLIDYCRIDVLAEEGLSHHLPDLIEDEQVVFLVDQAMNARGFALDREAVEAALRLIDAEFAEYNAELIALTGGRVERATQRDRMKAWLRDEGLNLLDTTAETLDDVLAKAKAGYYEDPELPPWADRPSADAIRGVELMRMLGRSSTAKYLKMDDWMSRNGSVHGGLLYHGAGTGRWSGQGLQPHNFPKGTLKDFDMGEAWVIIKRGTAEEIAEVYRSVMEALSNALRGAIVPRAGNQLYVADFAAIECRVLLWAAGQTDALQVFYENRCPYLDMASSIYGYPCWDPALDLDGNKKRFKTERNMGKPAVLGLGYQMGASKFVESAAGYGITLIEDVDCVVCGYDSREHRKVRDHQYTPSNPDLITSVKIVNAYRQKMDKVVAMWNDQNTAAVMAVSTRGRKVPCGVVTWHWPKGSDFLYCTLPSGRSLAYPFPEVKNKKTPWGADSWCMTFMGVDTYTKQWQRQTSYGGLLVENIVQAIARDLMAAAAVRCERSGLYVPILTVHDELIAEAPLGKGDVKEFEHMMAEVPDWGAGCPVEAEGWRGLRYRK